MTVKQFISEWNDSESDVIKAHTSGSTGDPKEILLEKDLVSKSALRTIRYFGLSSSSRLHLCLSPDYIAGKMMIVRSLLAEAELSVEEPCNHVSFSGCKFPLDLLAVVPSQLSHLLDDASLDKKVKNIIVGGSPLSPSLEEKCRQSGVRIVETYGMTETASHIALREVGEKYFTPLDGIVVKTDEDDSTLIIVIDGNRVFHTKDVAEVTSDRKFRILGRTDDAIITGGLKVHPALVEREISDIMAALFPGQNFVIAGREDDKWVNRVTLIVEGQTEKMKGTLALKRIREAVDAYKAPKEIIFIEKFPRTESGKIVRRLLI